MYIRDGRAHQHALTTNTRTHSRTNAHIIYTRTHAHTRTPHAQRTYVIYSVYVRVCARAYVPCASLLLRCVQWCVLAHELFARGPTDFEITPSDWPALAVYIKSANGSRATGRVPRTPCSPRYVIQQYCRPTDIHTSICQVFIYALFFHHLLLFFSFYYFTFCNIVIAVVNRVVRHVVVTSNVSRRTTRPRIFLLVFPAISDATTRVRKTIVYNIRSDGDCAGVVVRPHLTKALHARFPTPFTRLLAFKCGDADTGS